MFSLAVLLFHPDLLTPRRSGFLASWTSRLAATACTTKRSTSKAYEDMGTR